MEAARPRNWGGQGSRGAKGAGGKHGCLPALSGPLWAGGLSLVSQGSQLEGQSVSGELSGGSIQKNKNQRGEITKQRHFKKSG